VLRDGIGGKTAFYVNHREYEHRIERVSFALRQDGFCYRPGRIFTQVRPVGHQDGIDSRRLVDPLRLRPADLIYSWARLIAKGMSRSEEKQKRPEL